MPRHDYTTVPTELDDLPSTSHASDAGQLPRHLLPPHLASTSLSQYSPDDDDDSDEEEYSEKHSRDPEALRLGAGGSNSHRENRLLQWIRSNPSASPLGALLAVVVCLIVFLALHTSLATRNTFNARRVPVSFEHAFNGSLAYQSERLIWFSPQETVRKTDDGLEVQDVSGNNTRLLVKADDIKDERGRTMQYSTFQLSPDGQFILLVANSKSVYRHSTLSSYYIHGVDSGMTLQVGVNVQHAQWTPEGHGLVWVKGNDVYYKAEPEGLRVTRVSDTGSETVYNGVPDWVYEEEISATAMWFSPDSSKLIYLTFNDTLVPEYEYPLYSEDQWFPGKEKPYPSERKIRYPKPGYPNPQVHVHLYDLKSGALSRLDFTEPFKDPLLVDVAWVSPSDVLIKRSDRLSVILEESHFDLNKNESKTVRQTNFQALDGGWYEPAHTVASLYPITEGYLDLVVHEGYKHVAYFRHAADSSPRMLTRGAYEVVEVSAVDADQMRIYFIAARPSTDRRLYWVPLPTADGEQDKSPADPVEVFPESSYVDVAFGPKADYMHVLHSGQAVPVQRLVSTREPDQVYREQANEGLAAIQKTLQLPSYQLKQVNVSDSSPNVLEILPPTFDPYARAKHPVLFRVYGGPGSNTVTSGYNREWWHEYLASTHNYVVILVDGRGTGLRGRDFRTPVHGHLGSVEVQDVLGVAQYYASQDWVDSSRMGIWGWSFGGYLTSKVIESASGLFSLGLAVAPVTDWAFYDSIYTERYMGSVRENAKGYERSAVRSMDGFKNSSFYLAAGSGDDNVHFLHSATLLDYFTYEQVHDFRFRMFTDSAHSMSVRGARKELYEDMTQWMVRQWTKDRED